MNIELVTIQRRELEALIQDAVREAVHASYRDLRKDVDEVRCTLRAAKGVLSREDVAGILGCTPGQVRHHHKKGLRFSQPGKRAVYLLTDVVEYLETARGMLAD